jgi:hypothetical protein
VRSTTDVLGWGTGRKLVTAYLDEAKELGASEADLEMARNAVKAALGTLGADINPTLHKSQGVLMVIQNWLVLGLATITSLVDPIGMAVRGDLETAWAGLKDGLKEVKAVAQGDVTELNRLASVLGVNELHNTVAALGFEYGGYYVTGAARRWNDALFSINQLTSWTRLTRTMALSSGRRFLEKHGDFKYNKHSARFMRDLGLREGDVRLDKDGKLVVLSETERDSLLTASKQPRKAAEEIQRDNRIRTALNRFVDESILRPDAAQRPIWASDPHYMLLFHLKAFVYSFHERILRRVGSEIMQGNVTPAVTLLGYVPAMFIAEGLRNVFQGDDMEDSLGEDAGFFETSHYLAQKAGLYGVGQFYFDVKQGSVYGDTPLSVLGGPSVDHVLTIAEAVSTESASDDVYALKRSLPFHVMWKDWFE